VEVVGYRELKEKASLLPLMEQAFGWPFEEQEFAKSVKSDPRLKDGAVGFCGVEGNRAVGFVGVDDFVTRTIGGKTEKAGGVFGVATLPEVTCQGVCTKLLTHAHEYFLDRGYRFVFLTAGQPSVAHTLYCKLGYFDVASFVSAYKLKKPGKRESAELKRARALDFERILDFYAEHVKGRTGFVVRDEAYMKTVVRQYEIAAKECVTTRKGYVIFKKEKRHARVRELVAQDEGEMNRLIELVERQAQTVVIGRVPVGDPVLSRVYRSRGFTVLEKGHGVLMVKELVPEASFPEAYGSRFYMSALDHF
jgi:ribosomal protein S18 acetylase RimI-like enzyme